MNPMKSYINIINEAQETQALYESWQDVGKYLSERALSDQEIERIFTQVQADVSAGGGNRTAIGKGVDVAGAGMAKVSQAYQGLLDKVSNTGPVQAFDNKMDQLMGQLKDATGGDAGVNSYVQKYREFAKKHPIAQGILYSALVAAAGLATGGAGAPAAVGLLKMTDRLLQGDKFSQAMMKGATTGGAALVVQDIKQYFGGTGQMPAQQAQDLAAATDQRDLNPAGQAAAADVRDVNPDGQAAAADARDLNPRAEVKPATDASIAADNPGTPQPRPAHDITVKRGDTLSQIAKANRVSVKDLMQANPDITNPDVIKVGQRINVPQGTYSPTYDQGVGTASDTAKKVAKGIYKAAPKPRLAADKWDAGFSVVGLPLSEMIDVKASMQQNALTESTGDMSLVLTEAGVGAVLYNIAAYNQYLIEADRPGIFSRIGAGIKSAAGAVGKKLGTMAGNVTTKVTADKLQRAWTKAGSPRDSRQLMSFLQQQGIDKGIIANVYKGLNIPTQTGGRVKGAGLSQTANAIRKRNARAAAKAGAAPAAAPQPMSTGGTATANLGQVGGQAKPRVNVGRAATQPAGFKRDVSQLAQQPQTTVTKQPRAVTPKRLPAITVGKEKIQPNDPRYASLAKAMKGKTMQAAGYDNPGKLIAEARGLMKLAEFAPISKKDQLLAEASSAAQQAAIAISMKKAGKKPKKDEAVQPGQFVEPSDDAKQQIKANNQQSADKAAIGRAQMGIMPVDEEEKKGLYYYVNKRKKAGTSRSKDNPKAPSEQDWKDAAKTAKK